VTDGPTDAPPDASVDGPVDAPTDGTTNWTPANLAELQLWFEGSHVDGDAGPISSWPDQSPNHDNLTPSGGPTFVSNAIGGQPGVSISGSSGITGTLPTIGTTSYVAEIVARTALSTSTGTLWAMGSSFTDSTHCNFGFSITPAGVASATYYCTSSDTATMSFSASQAHVFGIRRTSTTQAQLRIDGNSTPFALTHSEAVGVPGTFGLGSMDAVIAEVVLATNPTDNDVTQLEAYLKTKYGL
jgi:hypothetical protein